LAKIGPVDFEIIGLTALKTNKQTNIKTLKTAVEHNLRLCSRGGGQINKKTKPVQPEPGMSMAYAL